MLARRPDSLATTVSYAKRLKLYRGQLSPDSLFASGDTTATDVATLAFGLANWHLVRGDTARARPLFERAIRSGAWPTFGFIASEAELARLRAMMPARRARSTRLR